MCIGGRIIDHPIIDFFVAHPDLTVVKAISSEQERRTECKSASEGVRKSVAQSARVRTRLCFAMERLDTVRPHAKRTTGCQRTIVIFALAPLLVVACILAAVALMAGNNESADGLGPNALAVSEAELKHLTKDKSDWADYPSWSKDVSDLNHEQTINHGLWSFYKGPPFLQRVTLYSGDDRDLTRGGQMVRRILGLPLTFGKWEGNTYINSFESQQMYYLQSNEHSALVVPPLSEEGEPILSDQAKGYLHGYVSVGRNTIVVTGGSGAIDFINRNLLVDGQNPDRERERVE